MTEERKKRRRPTAQIAAVSKFTTSRISLYLRCLEELCSEGVETISSKQLATRFGLNAAQIRKDLATFGEFGIRGVGYQVSALEPALRRILGLDKERSLVIVGAGNLGLALAAYPGFNSDGFRLVALFDVDHAKAGRTAGGIPIHPLESLCDVITAESVEIGVIAVPPAGAGAAHERLVEAGVAAILNFSPHRLPPTAGVEVTSVDLKINLEALSFHLFHDRS